MKRLLTILLAVCLMLSCVPSAYALDNSREFFFELSVDGKDTKEAKPGDIITVVYTLHRRDSDESYAMYAMQNEIRYDSSFFELVQGGEMLSEGISSTEIGLRDEFREYYMNFVSLTGGENWSAKRLVGSFQLKVIGTSSVSKITNQDYLVSTADGKDSYAAACQDVTVIVSTDCTVKFETNGGSKIDSVNAQYGETLTRPADPIREGHRLVGWYTDIDLQIPWDFETDTVSGNMTLYAKWEQGEPAEIVGIDSGSGEGFGGLWWLLLLGVIGLLLLLLLLFMGKKTVRFETGCDTVIENQKVKKGGLVQRPEQPARLGRIFAGWYADEMYTQRWDFEEDKVEDSMTLYAKWL